LPPLRKRTEDIEQLVQHFLKRAQRRLNKKSVESVSTEAMYHLSMYSYSKGSVTRAAELAGLPRKSFYRLMKKHGFTKKDFV